MKRPRSLWLTAATTLAVALTAVFLVDAVVLLIRGALGATPVVAACAASGVIAVGLWRRQPWARASAMVLFTVFAIAMVVAIPKLPEATAGRFLAYTVLLADLLVPCLLLPPSVDEDLRGTGAGVARWPSPESSSLSERVAARAVEIAQAADVSLTSAVTPSAVAVELAGMVGSNLSALEGARLRCMDLWVGRGRDRVVGRACALLDEALALARAYGH